jgi:hypothetical protein
MRLFFFILLLLLFSCSTIRHDQSDNVKAFAKSAKALSGVPGELYGHISDFRHQLKLVESSTIYTSDKIIARLDKILDMKKQFDQNAVAIKQSAMLIETYAECLLALTDESYKQFDKQSNDLSLKLNAAVTSYNLSMNQRIPPNTGAFLGGVVREIGSVQLKHLQKKYLKSFVDTGAHIINGICDYFTTSVAASLNNEMSSLDNQFSNIMTTFYDNIYEYQKSQNVNPFDYLRYYNPMYLEMKEKLGDLHNLQIKTIISMQKIKDAHEQLRLSVDMVPSKELIAEIKELYIITNEVQTAYQKVQN